MPSEQEEARLRAMEAKAAAFLRDIAEACLKHGLVIVNDYDSMAIEGCTPDRLRDLFDLHVGFLGESYYEEMYDDQRKRERELTQWLADIGGQP